MLRFRAKISFNGLLKRMSIVELFASTIMKCYYELQAKGFYPTINKEQEAKDE